MWVTTLNKMEGITDYLQHQLLWGFFDQNQDRPFCFCDAGDQIIMLSSVKPNTESKEVKFENGMTLMFECRASLNARRYKTVTYKPQDYTADMIKEWFRRRLEGCANVGYVTFKKMPPHMIVKSQNHKKIPLNQTMFFGTLTITDAEKFDEIASKGIGQGCAFGFGALILPQVMK